MVYKLLQPLAEDKWTAKCRLSPELFKQLQLSVGTWIKITSEAGYYVCKAWPQNHTSKEYIQADPSIFVGIHEGSGNTIDSPQTAREIAPIGNIVPAEKVKIRLSVKKSDLTTAQLELINSSLIGFVCTLNCVITTEKYSLNILETQPPNSHLVISHSTQILTEDPIVVKKSVKSENLEEDVLVGGLENVIHSFTEMLIYPLEYPSDFLALGIEPPKGILLYGPPGCGKTLVVRKVAHDSKLPLLYVDASQITGVYVGESEEAIRKEFENAEILASEHGACILFIDEIDALQESRGVVGQLLTLMDGIKKRNRVIVVAATNRPHTLDPALRRPGRLDREIEVNIPNVASRLKILQVHSKLLPLHSDVNLQEIAEMGVGYVGADLAAICREAALRAYRRLTSSNSDACVTQQDFHEAIKVLPPSTLKGNIVDDIPKTTWNDIGGLEEVKQQLIAAVEWPLIHRETYTKLGLHPPRGLLLHGPPGCAKTTLVKAVANSCKATFLTLPSASIFSPYLGEAEQTVRDAFRMARKARPSIIFFDEIDAIVAKREFDGQQGGGEGMQARVLSTLLNEMDGIEQAEGILVIGATNRLDMIDPALTRPGRFDKVLSVPPPDMASRLQILQIHTKLMPIDKDVDLNYLAQITNSFTGAEIENMCREAAFILMREDFNAPFVSKKHFTQAYEVVKMSIKRPTTTTFEFKPP